VKDIPEDFRISFRRNAPNPVGVLRSKGKIRNQFKIHQFLYLNSYLLLKKKTEYFVYMQEILDNFFVRIEYIRKKFNVLFNI